MNKHELQDRFARMWRTSREDAGKSQDYVAKKLGVSKRTVQNWECGSSTPNQGIAFEWFEVLGLQPLPYYLELLYGEYKSFDPNYSDKQVEEELIKRIKNCSHSEKRKMLYILNGNHGSSVSGILEMVTAHLQVPLKDRLNVASAIILNYELAEYMGNLIESDFIMPNIDILKMSFDNAKKSVMNNENSYSNTKCEKG